MTVLDLPYFQDPIDGNNTGICRQVDQRSVSFRRFCLRKKINYRTVKKPPVFNAEVIQISACRDGQVAHEDELDISSRSGGALITAFLHEVSLVSDKYGYDTTYRSIMRRIHERLRSNGLGQVPQFWTSHRFDLERYFKL